MVRTPNSIPASPVANTANGVLIEELSGHPPVDMEGALSDIGWRAMSLVGVGSAAGSALKADIGFDRFS